MIPQCTDEDALDSDALRVVRTIELQGHTPWRRRGYTSICCATESLNVAVDELRLCCVSRVRIGRASRRIGEERKEVRDEEKRSYTFPVCTVDDPTRSSDLVF